MNDVNKLEMEFLASIVSFFTIYLHLPILNEEIIVHRVVAKHRLRKRCSVA